MHLSDAKSAYEIFSGKASEIMRQLSLAGIAVIWLFRDVSEKTVDLDQRLVRAALLIFLALFCDLLQYLAGTVIWFLYFRYKEKRRTAENLTFYAPSVLTWPTWTLFGIKIAMMLLAYAHYIIPFLVTKFVT
jgi:hypothetical protein